MAPKLSAGRQSAPATIVCRHAQSSECEQRDDSRCARASWRRAGDNAERGRATRLHSGSDLPRAAWSRLRMGAMMSSAPADPRSVRHWIAIAAVMLSSHQAAAQGKLVAVSNEAGHTVTLIDAGTLEVTRTIAVPQRP